MAAQGDAWTTDRYPSRNLGTEGVLRTNSKPVKRAFVRFEVDVAGVRKATLRLYAQSAGSTGFAVHVTSPAWTETGITHASAPAAGALLGTVPPFAAAGTWQELDVTSAVNAAGPVAFQILTPEASADLVLTSREGGRAPELVLETGDPPVSTSPPAIAGTPRIGETLTAGEGAWTGTPPLSFAFQWLRCGPVGGGCADVPGATDRTYAIGPEEVDRTFRVRVTATNAAGSASATSEATARVPEPVDAPVPLAAPTVSGTPLLGRTLTAGPGSWTGTPPLSYAFQWLRCDAAGAACEDVEGATGGSFLLGPGDLGRTIRVRETATNAAGSASALSEPTAVVLDPGEPPASVAPPTVSGTLRIGETLTAAPGTWTGTPPIAFSFQWLRCGLVGGGCEELPGETGTTYVLGAADVDRTLRVREDAGNAAGTASATSEATGVVSDVPVPPPPPPPSSSCSRADATGCAAVAGSRISLLNARFTCNRPLADLAALNPIGQGPGRLPLLVEIGFTTYVDLAPAAVDLRQDCAGDGDDETIDLVLAVEGDGRTLGGTADAVKVRLTASDIQVTGFANCGPRGVGANGIPEDGSNDDAHQDGAQIQGGDTVEFIDFEFGDWETGTATCQGAAGTFVPGSVNGNPVQDMACIRCKSVSCNGGFLLSWSDGSRVIDSKWRTGNPADRVGLLANGQTGLCRFASPPCLVPPNEATNYFVLGNYCDPWPYEDEVP
ncbi:MAG TPA: DNRLRE domain-containing protein [Gaiellaceae bacterium]|nr:DNRLRE domain-containing protein [Gaiellaceae bacterium]